MGRTSARQSDTVLAEAACADAAGLLVLELRGNGYEMGYQHGALAREQIRSLHAHALDHVGSQADYPRGVPERVTRSALRSMLTYQMARMRPLVPQELWAEIEGIADGAGLTPYDILLLNVLWEHVAETACAHFAVTSTARASGPIHAVNFAVPEWGDLDWARYRVLVLAYPAEGQPFAHVSLVGNVGVIAGMGANGMAVSWERRLGGALPVWRQMAAPYRPVGFTGRRIVQYAPNLHTAESIVRSDLPRPARDIWLLSSARERASLGLEIAVEKVVARHADGDLAASEGAFASQNEQDGPGGRLWNLLTGPSRPLKVDGAVRILRDPYPAECAGQWHPLTDTICHPNTLLSAVMGADTGRIWAAAGEPPAPLGAYAGYSLNAADALSSSEEIPATGFRHARQACVHLLAGEWEQAQAQADQAAALDGETVPLALIRARALAGQGRHKEAVQALQSALAPDVSSPYRAMASHQLTQQHIALENGKEAAKAADRRDAFLSQSEGQVMVALPSAIDPVILLELSNWKVSEGRTRE